MMLGVTFVSSFPSRRRGIRVRIRRSGRVRFSRLRIRASIGSRSSARLALPISSAATEEHAEQREDAANHQRDPLPSSVFL